MFRQTEEEAARVRDEVAAPLTKQAEREGAAYLATAEADRTASTRLAKVGRFGRRKARDEQRAASEQAATIRARVRDVWEAEPPEWAARGRAEADPRVSDADQAVEVARTERAATGERHRTEQLTLLAREHGTENARAHQYGTRALNPRGNARNARSRSAASREERRTSSPPSERGRPQYRGERAKHERLHGAAAQRSHQLREPEQFER